jgi:hypothetical protein
MPITCRFPSTGDTLAPVLRRDRVGAGRQPRDGKDDMRRRLTVALLAGGAALVIGATPAHADHTDDIVAANDYPPSWFIETNGPDGFPDYVPGGTGDIFACKMGGGPSYYATGECLRFWGLAGRTWTRCSGRVGHDPRWGDPSIGVQFGCRVGVNDPQGFSTTSTILCSRILQGDDRSGTLQVTDTGWVPGDCRYLLAGWPDNPGLDDRDDQLVLGTVTRNMRQGTAELTASVNRAGAVGFPKTDLIMAAGARAGEDGTVTLPIVPRRKASRTLLEQGKLLVAVPVVFQPDSGLPMKQERTILLRRK